MDTLNNPRERAIQAIKHSIPNHLWQKNTEFVSSLKTKIQDHPLHQNPIVSELYSGFYDKKAIQNIHLDYRHAIVRSFTDALTMAQFQTRQLEPRLTPGAKIAPRFLLTLNSLDEFGFQPGLDENGYYQGNPSAAHYPLFENVLDSLGIDGKKRNDYTPSVYSEDLHAQLESSFTDYPSVLALLAAAEIQVIIFSPALRAATTSIGVDVSEGYYHVHGTTEDTESNAADDNHEDDLWNALTQACTKADYAHIESISLAYLDAWNRFWDYQRAVHRRTPAMPIGKKHSISTEDLRELDTIFS